VNASQLWPTAMFLCVACGSSFQASDMASGGAVGVGGAGSAGRGQLNGSGGGGISGEGGSAVAIGGSGIGGSSGDVGSAGASNRGGRGGTDASGSGGAAIGGTGGTDGPMGGSAGTSAGSGGTTGGGGSTGGFGGTGGSSTPDCTTLENTYLTDLAKARICDPSAMRVECSVSSTLPGGCGCPVLVAAGTVAMLKAKSDLNAFNGAGCHMAMCPVACIQYSAAACVLDASSNAHLCAGS
jgi:hypothetical protein